MPVKLKFDGTPLNEPPATAPPATATEALVAQAASIPMQATGVAKVGQPITAQAEVGTEDKQGNITMVVSEQIKTGMTLPPGYVGPVGNVTYGCATLVNLGNYENIRPFVQIEVPYAPGSQDAVYDWAFEWVDDRLSGIVNSIKNNVSGA